VRSFSWWFGMGVLLTLSVLMVQGGVRDLFDGAHPTAGASPYLSFTTTIFGGGLLAGCLALVMKRIR
jgi:hypothetical protein